MHQFAADDAKDELAFRKQLPSFLPADEPLRYVDPLLAVISGYAAAAPFRMLDMTDPTWKDSFNVILPTDESKDVCLDFWRPPRKGEYKSQTFQFEYSGHVLPAVDSTRPFCYTYGAGFQNVIAVDRRTANGYALSRATIIPEGRLSLCCTEPNVVYAAYREAGIPKISRITAGETRESKYGSDLTFGDIVVGKNAADGLILYIQTNRGPHRAPMSPHVLPLGRLLNDPTADLDIDGAKTFWSPSLLMLANGMLLAQIVGIGEQSAVVLVDPARFGWLERIAKLDMKFDSAAISRSDRNVIYVAADEKKPDRQLRIQSAVDDAVSGLPAHLSLLVADYADRRSHRWIPTRRLLALRMPSDFWI
jgi:hypothetical protein